MTNEELAVTIKSCTDPAMRRALYNQLWTQVSRFIATLARNRMAVLDGAGSVEFDDLYDAGFLALVDAVDRFDPERGRGGFLQLLKLRSLRAFSEAGNYVSGHQRHDPLHRAANLDAPVTGQAPDDGLTIADTIEDPSATVDFDNAERRLFLSQLREEEEAALCSLPGNQGEVVRRRYFSGEALDTVASAMGFTASYAGHIEQNALRRLRTGSRSRELSRFLDENTDWYLHIGTQEFQRTGSSAVEALALHRERLREMKEEALRVVNGNT